ncbi:C40 family peptidase [Saccharomonospora azurea]|uniref:Cell wall-associated hydrolase, invasion-associated protein n=1 Tax=Saccharomonospora azurea NA-128 TaxID=882081 RepID=H8G8E6_9PSEU|nr:C40 family peptidase [Saccharomonospora azurea]EHK88067.1 cell wall-associated hydrolase, invasion-associated protein [Saccharomonospora azurea SZMC 14600]EHY90468.1 cell wall-associated hydrolase, invasion-associated protein [Saccharomonospora azurea NA-128]
MTETAEVTRAALDLPDQFARRMRTDDAGIDAAVAGQAALRTSLDGVRGTASQQRVLLAQRSSGTATDNAVGTAQSLEDEVQALLDESVEIENAVAEAAEALKVGQVENDRVREEIIREISATMTAVAAAKQTPPVPTGGQAAVRQLMVALQRTIAELTGESADISERTLSTLTGIAGALGRDSGATTASSASTEVASSFNAQGAGGGGGGGGAGGGGGDGGGGGAVTKPRLPVAIPPQPGTGVKINLPGGQTVEAPNETAAKAVRAAISQLGVPYVWGGTARGVGLDCSGLTMTSYGEAGLDIPRLAQEQTVGAEVPSQDQLLPGDLVVWSGHVAMVVGDGLMIEAGDPVSINPIRTTNAGQQFIGFYRPTG